MLKPKSKSQPARLLSYGQSTSTPIAMAIAVTAGGTILSTLLQIINIGMSASTNHHVKGMTIVQLQDGSISPGKFAAPNEREAETIKRFISDSMIKMFGWNGIIEATENGENVTKPDRGIDIQTTKNSRKKIPTRAWEAAFALSENQDFRANFLKKLAEIVPSGVFNGEVQVSLAISLNPEKLRMDSGKSIILLHSSALIGTKTKAKESPLTKQSLLKLSILPSYQISQLNSIRKFI